MALLTRVHLVVSTTYFDLRDVVWSNITAAHCYNILLVFVTTTNYASQPFTETKFNKPFSGLEQLRAAEWRLNLRFENYFRCLYKGNNDENASDRRNVSLVAIQPSDANVSPRDFCTTTNHSSNMSWFPHIHIHNELTVDCLSLS
jgi:hypothetical protein